MLAQAEHDVTASAILITSSKSLAHDVAAQLEMQLRKLPTADVARASVVAMMAGADFIKTSTGKETVNATLPVGIVMVRAIRDYFRHTGMMVGFKPAGGIRTAKQSLDWLSMMKEELGTPWLHADLFRFGASGMLADIERQLEHYATGRYSADHRHPIA